MTSKYKDFLSLSRGHIQFLYSSTDPSILNTHYIPHIRNYTIFKRPYIQCSYSVKNSIFISNRPRTCLYILI